MQGLSPTPPRPQTQISIDDSVPAYRVTNKCGFVDDRDHLWPQGSMIYWEGQPSMGFEALNEKAHEKLLEYFKSLDALADKMAKEKGTSYAGLTGLYEARARIKDMTNLSSYSVDLEETMPILGAKQRGKSMARDVERGAPSVPMMGHRGRYEVAPQQAKGTLKLKNEGRDAVNADDKGMGS